MTEQGKGCEHTLRAVRSQHPHALPAPSLPSPSFQKNKQNNPFSMPFGGLRGAGCLAVSSRQGGRGARRQAIICPLSPGYLHMLREALGNTPKALKGSRREPGTPVSGSALSAGATRPRGARGGVLRLGHESGSMAREGGQGLPGGWASRGQDRRLPLPALDQGRGKEERYPSPPLGL